MNTRKADTRATSIVKLNDSNLSVYLVVDFFLTRSSDAPKSIQLSKEKGQLRRLY